MTTETPKTASLETATFGGGCFWCVEAAFEMLRGVKQVESGYAGGQTENPTYEQVCRGSTGHAEVVRITFDPAVLSFRDLLTVFFSTHDPTTLNRQGADVGTQYRSVIYFHSDEQKNLAEEFIRSLGTDAERPSEVVTELAPAGRFYLAEAYHQGYFRRPSRSRLLSGGDRAEN